MDHNCQYPDLKAMLKELALDMKEFVKDQLSLLEANMQNSQLKAVSDLKEKQSKITSDVEVHDQKIDKVFQILDEVRANYKELHNSYQQAIGAFKLWGFVCGAIVTLSTVLTIYMAFRK